MSIAAVDCPRCPSDAADWEPIRNADGIVIANVYQCKICALAWDDAGYVDPPQEMRLDPDDLK